MNVKNALKITSIGIAGGIIFRIISVLYGYDNTEGFYKGEGVLAWFCVGFIFAAAIASGVMTFLDKKTFFAPYSGTKSRLLGASAFLSGGVLLAVAVHQVPVFLKAQGLTEQLNSHEPLKSWIHLAFIAASALFGLLQIGLAPLLFRGSRIFSAVPALYLLSTVWGIINLFFMFVYYSHNILRQENIYLIVSSCLLVLALYYLSRYFAGVGKEHSARLLYAFGFPASILTVVYTGSNLLMRFLLQMHSVLWSVPMTVQAAQLAMAIFVFISLITIRKYDLQEPAGPRRMRRKSAFSAGPATKPKNEEPERRMGIS